MVKAGPTQSIKELLFHFQRTDWQSWHNLVRSPVCGWIFFIGLVLGITSVFNVRWEPLPSEILEGSISSRDIWSDRSYTIVDKQATMELKKKAQEKVLPVFMFQSEYAKEVTDKIAAAFLKVRERYKQIKADPLTEGEELLPQQVEDLRTLFTDALGVSISVRDFEPFLKAEFDESLDEHLNKSLNRALSEVVIESPEVLTPYQESGIFVLSSAKDIEGQILKGKSLEAVKTVEGVENNFKIAGAARIKGPAAVATLELIAQALILPTAVFDGPETEQRLQAAAAAVDDVEIRVQTGEAIIRKGDRFTVRDISIIEGIKAVKAKRNFLWNFVGTSLFIGFFLLGLYVFAARFLPRFNPRAKDLVCLGSGLLLTVLIYRVGTSMGEAIRMVLPVETPLSVIFYGIPVASGAMLIRLVRNAQEAFLFAIAAAVLVGFAPDMEISYMAYYLLAGVVGAAALNRADSRSALWKAGLVTGLAQMVLVVTLELIRSTDLMVALNAETLMWNMGFALMAGLLAALVTQAAAGLAEAVFGYVTDIRLLELSSLNHPLLRELIVRAPGTYHHSHLVGSLAESACLAIGANGLFARVSAYFHDIGKMTKADYFIENQSKNENRHEALNPSMSALIIQGHVKDGIELARKYGLPEPIVDIIPQHQGTKLIHFFYSKAKEQEDPNVETVDEKDYRYPGPRPQTREAGVILLADGVEAATRALPDKTPTKIRSTVEKIINLNFTDGQLDDCELTLRDIHDIGDSFINILTGIYHKRIEYPDIPDSERGRQRQGIHAETTGHPQSEPLKSSSSEETPRTTRSPLRDISRR